MEIRKGMLGAAIVAAGLNMGVAAQATVIGFDDLAAPPGELPIPAPAFSNYAEDGYSVTATADSWLMNLTGFGNPGPSIFSEVGTAPTIEVAAGGTSFVFLGVDLTSAVRGGDVDLGYTFTGLLDGSTVFTQSGTIATGGSPLPPFQTVASTSSDVQINSLRITLSGRGLRYVDNIEVNPYVAPPPPPPPPTDVPAPLSGTLLGLGVLALGVVRRRR